MNENNKLHKIETKNRLAEARQALKIIEMQRKGLDYLEERTKNEIVVLETFLESLEKEINT